MRDWPPRKLRVVFRLAEGPGDEFSSNEGGVVLDAVRKDAEAHHGAASLRDEVDDLSNCGRVIVAGDDDGTSGDQLGGARLIEERPDSQRVRCSPRWLRRWSQRYWSGGSGVA